MRRVYFSVDGQGDRAEQSLELPGYGRIDRTLGVRVPT